MGNIFSRERASKLKVDRKAASRWTVPSAPPTDTEFEKPSDVVSSASGSGMTAFDDTRTYHSVKSSPYVVPSDVKEGQRLNLHHHLVRQLFNGANTGGVSPQSLMKGLKVLDVGFGTGIWLAEMNRDFPKGTYYGVDLTISTFAETFRDLAAVGKINLTQGNVYERLPFDDNTFDYVHMQDVNSGIPERLWPSAITELCRVMKPGGCLDIVEVVAISVPTAKPDPLITDFDKKNTQILLSRGINLYLAHRLAKLLRENSDLQDVLEVRRTAPLGWDGQTGKLWELNAMKLFQGAADFMSAGFGMSKAEWLAHLDLMSKGWGESKSFLNVFRVTGKKRTGKQTF
ncbi:S-adenosyl-L-methionine-dependent methyltransferase [Cladochytrium replicatum]|nr:S-adenosyl-L-methionine-dependent methyltransferase [Cladochytrium replicatum]